MASGGADAHVGGVDAGDAEGDDAGERLGAELLRARLGGDQRAGGAVVEGRGVAGGDRAALAEGRAQLRHLLQRGVGARALVGVDGDRLAAPFGASIGTISSAKIPASAAATARWWLRRPKASWSSRLIP